MKFSETLTAPATNKTITVCVKENCEKYELELVPAAILRTLFD